ncbi:MAG TPA: Rrf2 family transcriptional regulator [Nostocaceae cyanobacterium]|nr:Rrf2 family transcriptional regulator [Nostocaceae cyanobacterium]
MELSNKSEYTILALIELAIAYSKGEPLQIREIATLQNIPNRYLEQILATLRRGGIIKSIRGAKGGYVLAREPGKITILDALKCIEGVDSVVSNYQPTSKSVEGDIIQEVWLEAIEAANSVLQKYTLEELCELRAKRAGEQLLMYYI